jgi:predicted DNA-binding transcriptional regulator YafY
MRHYRLDRILGARLHMTSFSRAPEFELADHSARAFGSFHDEREYGEVVWRFTAEAAPVARDFQFHPRQRLTDLPDGGLEVRFEASGHLEMAWHLYRWGDAVEVVAPAALRDLVERWRRDDFAAFP